MSDSLRDRIIAAIAKADQDWCSDNPLHEDMADAVIAALGARVQWRNDFYINTGQPPDDYTGPIRYVTGWQADE